MSCCVSRQAAAETKRCCCCSKETCYGITALVGGIIALLGALAIVSVVTGRLGAIRQIAEKAARGIGTSPLVLPVVIAALGGTILLAAILGYAHTKCTQN